MNDLKLISKTTPAVVTFNYAEIDKQLDEVLKKYGGLLFTDETVAECKKTIAELKKGKKSLNDFKIKTKKLLTEDITKFEAQCKLLDDKFNTVINPINIQAEAFEVKRREDKKAEIQTIIDILSAERVLNVKYAGRLVLSEQMLNKGTTMKSITVDLTKEADVLLSQQNIEKANIELIKSKVELANAQYRVTLPISIYLRMLEYAEVTDLTQLIIEDAERAKIKAEEAEAEILAIETRKAERLAKVEAEKVAQKEADRVNRERQVELAERRAADVSKWKAAEEESERAAAIRAEETKIESLLKTGKVPFNEPYIPKVAESVETTTETYEITGTEAELDALEEYLDAKAYSWVLM